MDDRSLASRDGRRCRPPLMRANGRVDDYRRASPEQRQGLLNREVRPFEINGYHLVETLLCHVFEQQELAVTCIYEDSVQVSELSLDGGEHRVKVGEMANVCANSETSASKRLLSRLQRPRIQAADGDARALSVEFLRCGQPDPAVAAGDEDILACQPTHCRHSFRLNIAMSGTVLAKIQPTPLESAGSDDESNHGGRRVPNHAPTVTGSVLHQDITGRQQHLHAIVKLGYDVA